MDKWEYQTHLSYKTKDFTEGIKDRIRICEMGEEGWELVSIIETIDKPKKLNKKTEMIEFWFKRKLESE